MVLAKQTQQQLHLLGDSIVLNVRQWRKFVYETGLNNIVWIKPASVLKTQVMCNSRTFIINKAG